MRCPRPRRRAARSNRRVAHTVPRDLARHAVHPFGVGVAFPWLGGMMLPALAAVHAGGWPVWAWRFGGSMAVVCGLHRFLVRAPIEEMK